MKKLFSVLFMVAFVFSINAQVKTPSASPSSKLEQKVGLTDITIEYSRPSVKGRTIFGDLVPYDKMWRTGANKNTMITFSTDATVGGVDVKKGTYALFTIPGETKWEFVLYTDTENWGTPEEFTEEKVAARVSATPVALPFEVPTFAIDLQNLQSGSADLELYWANVMVGVPVTVPTDAMVSTSIEKTMAGPAHGDFYSAAVYYKDAGKDLKQALTWIDKSMELRGERKFWVVRQRSEILAAMGDYKGAVKSAKESLALAEAASYDAYIKINKENIAKWEKM